MPTIVGAKLQNHRCLSPKGGRRCSFGTALAALRCRILSTPSCLTHSSTKVRKDRARSCLPAALKQRAPEWEHSATTSERSSTKEFAPSRWSTLLFPLAPQGCFARCNCSKGRPRDFSWFIKWFAPWRVDSTLLNPAYERIWNSTLLFAAKITLLNLSIRCWSKEPCEFSAWSSVSCQSRQMIMLPGVGSTGVEWEACEPEGAIGAPLGSSPRCATGAAAAPSACPVVVGSSVVPVPKDDFPLEACSFKYPGGALRGR